MEHQCWANAQFSRRKCLELVDVPHSVSDKNLEERTLKTFEIIGCLIEGNNIVTCHQISKTKTNKKNERIIVKFSKNLMQSFFDALWMSWL